MNKKDDLERLFNSIFSNRIKVQRTSHHISQTTAATRFDNYRQWIGKMESGVTSPSLYMLYKYSSSNGLDLLQALQETIELYEVEKQPLQALSDKKKFRDYLSRAKRKTKRNA